MASPMFHRAAQGAQPAPAPAPNPFPPAAVAAPFQAQPKDPQTVMSGVFAGISLAKQRKGGAKLPPIMPGHYLVRIDQVKFGVADGKGKMPTGSAYFVIEATNMVQLQDREGASNPPGSEFMVFYSNQKYPESFLVDVKSFLMAYFGMTQEQTSALKPDGTPEYSEQDWLTVIADAAAPEQVLKGAIMELRAYLNRKGTFTKTEWARRVFYRDLDKIMPRDAVRERLLPDAELQRMIALEAAVK